MLCDFFFASQAREGLAAFSHTSYFTREDKIYGLNGASSSEKIEKGGGTNIIRKVIEATHDKISVKTCHKILQ